MFLRFQGHRMDFRDTRSTSWVRNGPRVGAWNNSPNENSVETCPDRSYELVSIRISFGDLVQPPFWDHFGLLHVSPFSGTQDGFQGHTILFRVWRYEWLRSHTACVRSKVNLEVLSGIRPIDNSKHFMLFPSLGAHSFATQSSNFVRMTIVVVKSIVTTFAIMIVGLSETWFQSHSATIDVVTACSPAAGFHLMCPWKAWFQGHKTTKPCFLDG